MLVLTSARVKMTKNHSPRPHHAEFTPVGGDERPVAIGLHCSGADGSQWRKLAAVLAPGFAFRAPDFIGTDRWKSWHGRRAFTLADEAQLIATIIDVSRAPVHLIGHSYGGAVAMRVAAARPSRIASLTLYEPSAFYLLRDLGSRGGIELAEIERIAHSVVRGLASGAYVEAAATFVDYWNGDGAWAALREDVRASLLRWAPHAALHFHALLSETMPLTQMRLGCPVLVMRGEHALGPSRLLAETISQTLSGRPATCIPGAGHMGPITHADAVNAGIAAHLAKAKTAWARSPCVSRDAA
jgi:pimeloyl-ACP methyl ester carboxylesterase